MFCLGSYIRFLSRSFLEDSIVSGFSLLRGLSVLIGRNSMLLFSTLIFLLDCSTVCVVQHSAWTTFSQLLVKATMCIRYLFYATFRYFNPSASYLS